MAINISTDALINKSSTQYYNFLKKLFHKHVILKYTQTVFKSRLRKEGIS